MQKMKLFAVAFLAALAVSSAINVAHMKGKAAQDDKMENNPFTALCTELRTFKSSWEAQKLKYNEANEGYKSTIAQLKITLDGDANEAQKKIFAKREKVVSIQGDVKRTNQAIDRQEGTLETVGKQVADATAQQKAIEKDLKKQYDLTKQQEQEALANIKTLKQTSEKSKAEITKVTKELDSCNSEKLKKSAQYKKFLQMSQNTFTVEDRVEKSFGVVQAEIKTAQKTVMTASKKSFNLDTGEIIYTGGSQKTVTETYKKVTTGSASVRAELKRDTNELREYLMSIDKEFAAQVNDAQKKALDEKMTKSKNMADQFMKDEIAQKQKDFENANKLRFAGKSLLKAVNDISKHLDSHTDVMNKMYKHYHRFAQSRDQAASCTAKDCGLMVTHTAAAFKTLAVAATGEFTSMYTTLCTLEKTVSKNYDEMIKLQKLKVQDDKLTKILVKFNKDLDNLKKQYLELETSINNEKKTLTQINTRTVQIKETMQNQINVVINLVKESNNQITNLEASIEALAKEVTQIGSLMGDCKAAQAKIAKDQAELIRSVKVVGEIKTTAKMAMEVVVEKQAANYDHINAANDKLNNVIKGFSTLGDKTKFFTREMWGPGGEEYFQKFLR